MLGKMSNSRLKPTALGTIVNSSTYNQTIPVIFGRTAGGILVIWAANLRQIDTSGKKVKGKGVPVYGENADFLVGTNPIVAPLQCWTNGTGGAQSTKYAMNFVKWSGTIPGDGLVTIPDSKFYAVLAVTISAGYSASFDDYGAPGPQSVSGSFEMPCWNTAMAGPNPLDLSASRYFPWVYYWMPGSGPTIFFEAAALGFIPLNYNIYYAQLTPKYDHSPIAHLNLQWEAMLGSGTEYADAGNIPNSSTPYTTQQIIYPQYAGLGSSKLDLGASGMIPQLLIETQGAYGVEPWGDADFVDMVEHIVRAGQQQAAFGAQDALGNPITYADVQSGLGCWGFPGAIQKKGYGYAGSLPAMTYDLPNKEGNILVAFSTKVGSGGVPTISDSAGNAWDPVITDGPVDQQAWTATAVADAQNTVTVPDVSAPTKTNWALLEIAGLDTVDVTATAKGTSGPATLSITTTNRPGEPCYIVALYSSLDGNDQDQHPNEPQWNSLLQGLPPYGTDASWNWIRAWSRNVRFPSTYTITIPVPGAWRLVLISFKNSQPVDYPRPLGDILDDESMNLVRAQCRANGLWGSLNMDSQKKASEWMADIAMAGNFEHVWSGFKLKLIPRSEVSAAGNGAIYTAPTTPVFALDDADYIVGNPTDPPVTIDRKARVDAPNVLQFQHPYRGSDYNQISTAEPDPVAISLYGVRKGSPKTMPMIQDIAVAQMILGVQARRETNLRNNYKFTLQAKHKLLEPMDVGTITDSKQGIDQLPVRLTSVSETPTYEIQCEAEDFQYGLHSPLPLLMGGGASGSPSTVTPPDPNPIDTTYTPRGANPPTIFEPPPQLYPDNVGGLEIWLMASGLDPKAVGYLAYISIDGGSSYTQLGAILGNAMQGVAGPLSLVTGLDSVNNMGGNTGLSAVDPPSQSNATRDNLSGWLGYLSAGAMYVGGALLGTEFPSSVLVGDVLSWDFFPYGEVPPDSVMYYELSSGSLPPGLFLHTDSGRVDGTFSREGTYNFTVLAKAGTSTGSSFPCSVTVSPAAATNYELISWGMVNPTGTHAWVMRSGIQRGVFGTLGVDRPLPVEFCGISSASNQGRLRYKFSPTQIGQTLHFKLCSMSAVGSNVQNLSDVPAYPYTVLGTYRTIVSDGFTVNGA